MLAFIDIETTGLDPERHEVWEIAYHRSDLHYRVMQLPVTLQHADPDALRINRFHARRDSAVSEAQARSLLLEELAGAILVGNNVAFDAAFLRAFLGSAPWHYHIVDVKALVAGKLGWEPPWSTEDLLKAAGVSPVKKHEALADCLAVKALYEFALSV